MNFKNIKEIKECRSDEEANKLLLNGGWSLLELKIEKVRVPAPSDQLSGTIYEEKLAPLYILARK